jgi:ABC-type transport system involved in cytochrome c biogenesis permease subunit
MFELSGTEGTGGLSGLFGVLFWAMLVLYALMVAAQIYGQIFRKDRWVRWALWGVAAGFVLHTALVVWRWVETGHVPTIGNFENAWREVGSSSA